MQALYYFLLTLFLIVSLLMIGLVLLQKGRGGGLSGAFGGAGGNTAFGTKTGDVLTWATSVLFGIFILLAVFLNLVANRIGPGPVRTTNNTSPITIPGTNTPPPANNVPAPMPIGQ